jgi:predicted acetyltransferase
MRTSTAAKRDTYEIRLVTEKTIDQAEDLWCFTFSPTWLRDHWVHEMSTVYGAFHGRELHAAAAIIDMQMNIAGQSVPCGGICAVATAPGQRQQGLVAKLMQQCMRDLHDRKVPISALHPFSYPFYEKMGYAMTHKLYEVEVATMFLSRVGGGGNAKAWEMLPANKCEETLPVHHRMWKQSNLCLDRTPLRSRINALAPGRHWQYFIHEDGYIIADLDRCRDRRFYVLEFVHNTPESYLDGLALLGQLGANYDTVVWYDYEFERLLQSGLPEPRPSIKVIPWMMSRVVHLKQFEKLLPKSLSGLKVYDPLGVSADERGDLSTGELLQLVSGTWQTSPERFPGELHGILGSRPIYSIERF